MKPIRTNRELYLAVSTLIGTHRSSDLTLEAYLRSLWDVAVEKRDRDALSGDEFIALLSEAFSRPAPPFDQTWRERYDSDPDRPAGYAGWEARILSQIVDLREMADRGMLDDALRCFGIDALRGGRWYNFDPCGYLECATAAGYPATTPAGISSPAP